MGLLQFSSQLCDFLGRSLSWKSLSVQIHQCKREKESEMEQKERGKDNWSVLINIRNANGRAIGQLTRPTLADKRLGLLNDQSQCCLSFLHLDVSAYFVSKHRTIKKAGIFTTGLVRTISR